MPTQTYTPSASWNNTAQYQQSGDRTNAPIAQDGGLKALDNIAYLTGSNTSSSVRRLAIYPTLSDVKNIPSAFRRDEDSVMVADPATAGIFTFYAASTATADDYYVLQPAAGTGRWLRGSVMSPESTSVRDIITGADLTAKGIDMTDVKYASFGGSYIQGNGPEELYGSFGSRFNSGDVLTSLDVYLAVAGGGAEISVLVEHYRYSGAGAPTRTTLATITTSGNTVLGTPVTWSKDDRLFVTAYMNASAAPAGSAAYLYWIAANATRSYIRE